MTTYISSEDIPDAPTEDRINRLSLRVSSVEGQLYTLGAEITELRKKIDEMMHFYRIERFALTNQRGDK